MTPKGNLWFQSHVGGENNRAWGARGGLGAVPPAGPAGLAPPPPPLSFSAAGAWRAAEMLSPMLAPSWGTHTHTIIASSTARTPSPNRTPPHTHKCLPRLSHGVSRLPLPPAGDAAQPPAWTVPHRVSPGQVLHKHPLVLIAGGEPWHNGSPRGGGRTGSTHWSRSLSWNALLRCSSRPRDISGAESGSCAARGGSGGAGRGAAIAGRPRWRRHTVLLPGAARGSRSGGFLPTALSVTREARSTHRVVCGSGTEPMGNPGCSMACHSQKP